MIEPTTSPADQAEPRRRAAALFTQAARQNRLAYGGINEPGSPRDTLTAAVDPDAGSFSAVENLSDGNKLLVVLRWDRSHRQVGLRRRLAGYTAPGQRGLTNESARHPPTSGRLRPRQHQQQ